MVNRRAPGSARVSLQVCHQSSVTPFVGSVRQYMMSSGTLVKSTCVHVCVFKVCTRGRVYVDLRNVIHIPGAINRLLLHRVGAIQMNKH